MFLKAFLLTGGIEKVNRVLLRALYDLQLSRKVGAQAVSPYAIICDPRYFPEAQLLGYRGQRWRFMLDMLWKPWRADVLLLSHLNLAPAVNVLKWRYPKLKIVLIAHGIEVWEPVGSGKRRFLQQADRILAVSRYTRERMIEVHGIEPARIRVLPNCLDPFFQPPADFNKPSYLLERYGLQPDQPVLLTLSRLNGQEGYKGYDKVIESLPALRKRYPALQYILAGQYDETEKARLYTIIQRLKLQDCVRLTGFVPDEELIDHYRLADVFVMPSKKEGFGLVFIEAMACGTPAIGGNQDGSVEALRPNELGLAVDPDDLEAITGAIDRMLSVPPDPATLQRKVMETFGYQQYRERLGELMMSDE